MLTQPHQRNRAQRRHNLQQPRGPQAVRKTLLPTSLPVICEKQVLEPTRRNALAIYPLKKGQVHTYELSAKARGVNGTESDGDDDRGGIVITKSYSVVGRRDRQGTCEYTESMESIISRDGRV